LGSNHSTGGGLVGRYHQEIMMQSTNPDPVLEKTVIEHGEGMMIWTHEIVDARCMPVPLVQ
jgi:hypothetical protein